jgi:hypothetical protein
MAHAAHAARAASSVRGQAYLGEDFGTPGLPDVGPRIVLKVEEFRVGAWQTGRSEA